MFQARVAARIAKILQLQRFAAGIHGAAAIELAQCDGSLACDKSSDKPSFIESSHQRFLFGNGGSQRVTRLRGYLYFTGKMTPNGRSMVPPPWRG